MGKNKLRVRESSTILAKRRRMAAHIKEANPEKRKMKVGAFLRKYGKVMIGGGLILIVIFCAIFANVLTDWDPEKLNISEQKMRPSNIVESNYGFGVEIASDGVQVTVTRADLSVYLCQFYTADGAEVVEKPKAGEEYRMGVVKKNQPDIPLTYLTGTCEGTVMHTTQNIEEAGIFGLDQVGEGKTYNLHVTQGGVKSYINMWTDAQTHIEYIGERQIETVVYDKDPTYAYCTVDANAQTIYSMDDDANALVATMYMKEPAYGLTSYLFGVEKVSEGGADFEYTLWEEDGKTAVTEVSPEGTYRLGTMEKKTVTKEVEDENGEVKEEEVQVNSYNYLTTEASFGELETTTALFEAAEFHIEPVADGFYLYVQDEDGKHYTTLKYSGETCKVVFEDEPSTTYNYYPNTGLLNNNEVDRKEVVKTKVELVQNSNKAYVLTFYNEKGELVEKPEPGNNYKMGLIRENFAHTVVYYLTGEKSGNTLSTTTDIAEAVDFSVETVDDTYFLRVHLDEGTSYMNIVVKNNRVKVTYDDMPLTHYTLERRSSSLKTEIERVHVLGTDRLGRDMWSRLIFGSRSTLLISLGAQAILTISGTLLGLLCGYYTKVEKYLMRVLDAMATIPNLLLCLLMVSVFGAGIPNMMLAMSFHGIPGLARMVRNQVLSLREKEYIESEKAMGANDVRTVILHIMPACSSYLLVRFSSGLAGAILSMTSLSYLGVGLDPTVASWGGIINDSQKELLVLPYLFLIPTAAIAIAVFGFAMLGDGLRDLLDPKLR